MFFAMMGLYDIHMVMFLGILNCVWLAHYVSDVISVYIYVHAFITYIYAFTHGISLILHKRRKRIHLFKCGKVIYIFLRIANCIEYLVSIYKIFLLLYNFLYIVY